MAHVRRKFTNDVGEQDLLPGIPDHITIQNIAPKIIWKACNMLQMVSRGWQKAIYNRSVYNSKVSSRSTEGFLVIPYVNYDSKLVLILYACKGGSSLQLPAFPITKVFSFKCICLDGKVYVWVVLDDFPPSYVQIHVQIFVLDLAGDKRWTHVKQLKFSYDTYNYGILNGKIYRFQGYIYPTRGVLNGGMVGLDLNKQAGSLPHELKKLPPIEVYNPLSDDWSFVTRVQLRYAKMAPKGDLHRHFACFSEWVTEQVAINASNIFVALKRSGWKRIREQQLTQSGTSSILDDRQDEMDARVYQKTPGHPYPHHLEDLLFCGGKLLKFTKCPFDGEVCSHAVIEIYDTEKNTWEHWKSFSIKLDFGLPLIISDWAYADNAIWVTVVHYDMIYLMRSSILVKEQNDKSVMLIDTQFSREQCAGCPANLRPIYS